MNQLTSKMFHHHCRTSWKEVPSLPTISEFRRLFPKAGSLCLENPVEPLLAPPGRACKKKLDPTPRP